jgi:hypothetical protein
MIGMKRDTGIAAAIQELAPGAQWVIRDNDYDQIEWYSEDQEKPTREQIDAKIAELEESAPMDAVREIRNWALQSSDWTQAADIRAIRGEVWSAAWDSYRQELRDITESGISPFFNELGILEGVNFPEKPAS